jgi:hypothetical protein
VRSEEGKSINTGFNDPKEQEGSKKAYNIRSKSKPQKYKYGEDDFEYTEKVIGRPDGPRRGRPSSKR